MWYRLFWSMLIGLLLLAACGKEDKPTANSPASVEALITVERAAVFPQPDRNLTPFTYVYERERIPVLGKTEDGTFLLVQIENAIGWILTVQVELNTDQAQLTVVTPIAMLPTATPAPTTLAPTETLASSELTATPEATRTPLPTLTPIVQPIAATVDPNAPTAIPPFLPGVPPPLTLTLPEGWQGGDFLISYQGVDAMRDQPLSIYSGPLPNGARGYIYLFWAFPNVLTPSGEYNLWGDALQLLRGALIGETCNLGIDLHQYTFYVGGREGVGTQFTAADCQDQPDAAGWFAALRVENGNYAFFTAVEPPSALPDNVNTLQAILESVTFTPQ
jgi:hypothetical protein